MSAGLDYNLMECINISKKKLCLTEGRAGRNAVRSNLKSRLTVPILKYYPGGEIATMHSGINNFSLSR